MNKIEWYVVYDLKARRGHKEHSCVYFSYDRRTDKCKEAKQ